MRPSCPIYASRYARSESVSSGNPSPELCKITGCPGLSLVRLVSDAGCLIVDYSKDKLGIRNSKLRSFKYPRSGALMNYVKCKEEGSVYRSREV
jgi:hypothetical protein